MKIKTCGDIKNKILRDINKKIKLREKLDSFDIVAYRIFNKGGSHVNRKTE